MKRLLFVTIALALLFVATGGAMRTPITKPGFDNIPTLIDVNVNLEQFVNTAAEVEIYRVTIPRGTLGLTDRVVKVELEYAGWNFSGGNKGIVWRVYYGTAAPVVVPADVWANVAAFRFSRLNVWLINQGNVNEQIIIIRDESNKFTGDLEFRFQESNKELDLVITFQFSAAHAQLEINRLVIVTSQIAP